MMPHHKHWIYVITGKFEKNLQYFTSFIRCICPGGSWGPRCKVLGRSFFGSGWVWVRPLPLCLPSTISLRILTRQSSSLILYSGPLGSHQRHSYSSPTPMMALQLLDGRPQLLVEGGLEAIKLEVNTLVNDGKWHTFHIQFGYQVKCPKVYCLCSLIQAT